MNLSCDEIPMGFSEQLIMFQPSPFPDELFKISFLLVLLVLTFEISKPFRNMNKIVFNFYNNATVKRERVL